MQPLDAARVKEWRHQRMLSQQEVADRAGTSLFTIQRIERGEGNVRPKTGRGLAAALGVPIEELLPKAQAPLFREPPDQGPLQQRREYAEHLLAVAQSEGLQALTQDFVLAERLYALQALVDRHHAAHKWRSYIHVVEDCIRYMVGRTEYYEKELERGRAEKYGTADSAVTLAQLAIDEFSSFNRWLHDGPARGLRIAIETGAAAELDEEFGVLEDRLVKHTVRAQRALLRHALQLTSKDDQGDRERVGKLTEKAEQNVVDLGEHRRRKVEQQDPGRRASATGA